MIDEMLVVLDGDAMKEYRCILDNPIEELVPTANYLVGVNEDALVTFKMNI